MQEIESGERKPLPQSAVLGAKDLPRTFLSDHIEQRLFKRLKQERQERSRHLGKTFDEVSGIRFRVLFNFTNCSLVCTSDGHERHSRNYSQNRITTYFSNSS